MKNKIFLQLLFSIYFIQTSFAQDTLKYWNGREWSAEKFQTDQKYFFFKKAENHFFSTDPFNNADSLNIFYQLADSMNRLNGKGFWTPQFQKDSNFDLSVDAFENELFRHKKKAIEMLKRNQHKLSKAQSHLLKICIEYNYYGKLLAYPVIKGNKNPQGKVMTLPAEFQPDTSVIPLNAPSVIHIPAYQYFVKYYIIYETSRLNGFNKFNDYNISFEKKNAVAKALLNKEVYEMFLKNYLWEMAEMLSPANIEYFTVPFRKTDKAFYTQVLNISANRKVKVPEQSGTGSWLDSEFINTEGKKIKLSDFRDKVLYIDIWASWCGPCRQQMPFSEKLQQKFSKKELKNVKFIYISIDEKKENWLKAVSELGLKGETLWQEGAWNSFLIRHFGVNSIPRYILIDKGEVILPDAPRPSDERSYDEIMKLLSK